MMKANECKCDARLLSNVVLTDLYALSSQSHDLLLACRSLLSQLDARAGEGSQKVLRMEPIPGPDIIDE
jgi:hypothetical protein